MEKILDSEIINHQFCYLQISENVQEKQKDGTKSDRNSPALLPPVNTDHPVVTGRKIGDNSSDKFILIQSTHGSIKSINSFDDKKLESPLRNSESERGRGFEPEGKKLDI